MKKKLRNRFWVQAALACGCLCRVVGCPQNITHAFKDGTRNFFETGLTSAILSAFDLDQFFTDLMP